MDPSLVSATASNDKPVIKVDASGLSLSGRRAGRRRRKKKAERPAASSGRVGVRRASRGAPVPEPLAARAEDQAALPMKAKATTTAPVYRPPSIEHFRGGGAEPPGVEFSSTRSTSAVLPPTRPLDAAPVARAGSAPLGSHTPAVPPLLVKRPLVPTIYDRVLGLEEFVAAQRRQVQAAQRGAAGGATMPASTQSSGPSRNMHSSTRSPSPSFSSNSPVAGRASPPLTLPISTESGSPSQSRRSASKRLSSNSHGSTTGSSSLDRGHSGSSVTDGSLLRGHSGPKLSRGQSLSGIVEHLRMPAAGEAAGSLASSSTGVLRVSSSAASSSDGSGRRRTLSGSQKQQQQPPPQPQQHAHRMRPRLASDEDALTVIAAAVEDDSSGAGSSRSHVRAASVDAAPRPRHSWEQLGAHPAVMATGSPIVLQRARAVDMASRPYAEDILPESALRFPLHSLHVVVVSPPDTTGPSPLESAEFDTFVTGFLGKIGYRVLAVDSVERAAQRARRHRVDVFVASPTCSVDDVARLVKLRRVVAGAVTAAQATTAGPIDEDVGGNGGGGGSRIGGGTSSGGGGGGGDSGQGIASTSSTDAAASGSPDSPGGAVQPDPTALTAISLPVPTVVLVDPMRRFPPSDKVSAVAAADHISRLVAAGALAVVSTRPMVPAELARAVSQAALALECRIKDALLARSVARSAYERWPPGDEPGLQGCTAQLARLAHLHARALHSDVGYTFFRATAAKRNDNLSSSGNHPLQAGQVPPDDGVSLPSSAGDQLVAEQRRAARETRRAARRGALHLTGQLLTEARANPIMAAAAALSQTAATLERAHFAQQVARPASPDDSAAAASLSRDDVSALRRDLGLAVAALADTIRDFGRSSAPHGGAVNDSALETLLRVGEVDRDGMRWLMQYTQATGGLEASDSDDSSSDDEDGVIDNDGVGGDLQSISLRRHAQPVMHLNALARSASSKEVGDHGDVEPGPDRHQQSTTDPDPAVAGLHRRTSAGAQSAQAQQGSVKVSATLATTTTTTATATRTTAATMTKKTSPDLVVVPSVQALAKPPAVREDGPVLSVRSDSDNTRLLRSVLGGNSRPLSAAEAFGLVLRTGQMPVFVSAAGDSAAAGQLSLQQSIESFEFNAAAVPKDQQIELVLAMFACFGLPQAVGCPPTTLANWVGEVRARYRPNPYHCFEHALDVMQTVFAMLVTGGAAHCLPVLDAFALLVAAIGHDTGHPGTNNVYQINTESSFAVDHNDRSVLESHHAAEVYRIARSSPDRDIFCGLEPSDRRRVRRVIVDSVLATDMKSHFDLLGKMRAACVDRPMFMPGAEMRKGSAGTESSDQGTAGGEGGAALRDSQEDSMTSSLRTAIPASQRRRIGTRDDRLLLASMLLHSADISNPAKPWDSCKMWAQRITNEFHAQGDLERAQNLDISPMCDREGFDFAKSQVNFIDFIVEPTMSLLEQALPECGVLSQYATENRARWAELGAKQGSMAILDLLEQRDRDSSAGGGGGGTLLPSSRSRRQQATSPGRSSSDSRKHSLTQSLGPPLPGIRRQRSLPGGGDSTLHGHQRSNTTGGSEFQGSGSGASSLDVSRRPSVANGAEGADDADQHAIDSDRLKEALRSEANEPGPSSHRLSGGDSERNTRAAGSRRRQSLFTMVGLQQLEADVKSAAAKADAAGSSSKEKDSNSKGKE